MLRRILSLSTAVLLVNLTFCSTFAGTKADDKVRLEKLKAEISKLGTGPEARIEVKLLDKRKITGYLTEVSDEAFVVADSKRGTTATIMYPQVQTVKGNNLSKGAKIAITVGVVFIAIALLGVLVGKAGN